MQLRGGGSTAAASTPGGGHGGGHGGGNHNEAIATGYLGAATGGSTAVHAADDARAVRLTGLAAHHDGEDDEDDEG